MSCKSHGLLRLRKLITLTANVLHAVSMVSMAWEWITVAATEDFFCKAPAGLDNIQPPTDYPTAAILTPLKGASSANRASIISMLRQDYPDYEVIVGIDTKDAEAAEMIRGLQQFNPNRLRFVTGANVLGGQPKVSNLHHALQSSNAPVLAMIDADILARTDLLKTLIEPLLDPAVGLTTCLYRASPGGGLWSRMDALWNSTTYLPSALIGRRVIGDAFAFGAAIGIRRDVLDRIGGFAAIAPKVGDDYQLGQKTSAAGFKVRFIPYIVTEQTDRISLKQFVNRRVRWSRTIRTHQTAGYAGSAITYGLPWAFLALILQPRIRRNQQWLTILLINRLICALLNRRRLEPGAPIVELLLLPLRDTLALYIWARGFSRGPSLPAAKK